ncbi:peptide-methionine (R)-S-oxide reductase MsrB (plasmid) [Pseudorhodobacter turbinis]|uniref:peptide-methionine (R)-S-oxide reductase n=1 Tax=Pseudorhodobacter turbinis TaxID=2500533 RepID=A0A4P8EK65_9RHOB|nr:peptide-methionine (R)-S-oxide reductase MsrB [Pseudorhodobacter turbinis]QCO57398.1 peptide-methionine (R)-S-oxide reductase MsrB [Pseudorhodobacter turbinis]
MLSRRSLLTTTLAAAGLCALPAWAAEFEITFTPAEWKARLSPAQYAVLREEATERAFSNTLKGETSPLLKEAREGNYHCAGCDLPVYASATKYDSGTGWPSFYAAIEGAVGTKEDNSLFSRRTEVHCRRCGGHLGHIFDDGPQPTGKRHCLNGLAMTFTPA